MPLAGRRSPRPSLPRGFLSVAMTDSQADDYLMMLNHENLCIMLIMNRSQLDEAQMLAVDEAQLLAVDEAIAAFALCRQGVLSFCRESVCFLPARKDTGWIHEINAAIVDACGHV